MAKSGPASNAEGVKEFVELKCRDFAGLKPDTFDVCRGGEYGGKSAEKLEKLSPYLYRYQRGRVINPRPYPPRFGALCVVVVGLARLVELV